MKKRFLYSYCSELRGEMPMETISNYKIFTAATKLCMPWPIPWLFWRFRNSTFSWGRIVNFTLKPQPLGRGTTFHLSLQFGQLDVVGTTKSLAPASIAVRFAGVRRSLLRYKRVFPSRIKHKTNLIENVFQKSSLSGRCIWSILSFKHKYMAEYFNNRNIFLTSSDNMHSKLALTLAEYLALSLRLPWMSIHVFSTMLKGLCWQNPLVFSGTNINPFGLIAMRFHGELCMCLQWETAFKCWEFWFHEAYVEQEDKNVLSRIWREHDNHGTSVVISITH